MRVDVAVDLHHANSVLLAGHTPSTIRHGAIPHHVHSTAASPHRHVDARRKGASEYPVSSSQRVPDTSATQVCGGNGCDTSSIRVAKCNCERRSRRPRQRDKHRAGRRSRTKQSKKVQEETPSFAGVTA